MLLFIFISSLLTSMVIIVVSGLLFFHVKELQAKHLNQVSFGLFLQAMLPFSFIPQGLFEGSSYEFIMTIIAQIGATLFMIGLLIFTWNLKIHQSVIIPKRYIGLVFIIGFIVAIVLYNTKVMWINNTWVIERSVTTRLLLVICLTWVIIEDIFLFANSIRYSRTKWDYIPIAYVIGLALSFVMLMLRENLGLPSTAYHIPTSIGGSLFVIALSKSPQTMIIPSVKVSNIILAHRESGIGVVHFSNDKTEENDLFLTANALSGIVQIIKEIAGKPNLPQKLGYADYSIGIYPVENIFIYSISNGSHPLLDGLLANLATSLDKYFVNYSGLLDNHIEEEFKLNIQQNMGIFLSTS